MLILRPSENIDEGFAVGANVQQRPASFAMFSAVVTHRLLNSHCIRESTLRFRREKSDMAAWDLHKHGLD